MSKNKDGHGYVVWADEMTRALLNHLESNKGANGLYTTDRKRALENAAAEIAKVTPSGTKIPSYRNVASKLETLHRKYGDKRQTYGPEKYKFGVKYLGRIPKYLRHPRQTSPPASTSQPSTQMLSVEIPSREREIGAEAMGYSDDPEQLDSSQRFDSCLTTPASAVYSTSSLVEAEFSNSMIPQHRGGIYYSLVELLDTDPHRNNPSSNEIAREFEDLQDAIMVVVQDFVLETGISEASVNLREDQFSLEFLTISKRMFGAKDRSGIIECVLEHGMVIHLSYCTFLRSFIAAAITEWVFRGWVIEFDHKNHRSDILEQRLKEINPILHETIVRDCQRRSVAEKMDGSIRADAGKLARDLHSALHGITARPAFSPNPVQSLVDALQSSKAPWPQRWQEGLRTIFERSLKIKARLALSSLDYKYQWPRMNEVYDPRWMTTEEPTVGRESRKIFLSLMPAIFPVQTASTDLEKRLERPLAKAVVFLFPAGYNEVAEYY